MAETDEFTAYVLDQLKGTRRFEAHRMFGGTALLQEGTAFAKVKHGALWLKADDQTREDFTSRGMPQYTYGKDNSRRLNFFQTPPEVLEDAAALSEWAVKASAAARRSAK